MNTNEKIHQAFNNIETVEVENIFKPNTMRIENIANNKEDNTFELTIFGTESEVEAFGDFTQFTSDFIEEELNDEYSITIMGNTGCGKKDFRSEVTAELKAFRKL